MAALLNVAHKLDVTSIINKYVKSPRSYIANRPTRNNLTVGITLLLGSIGRICMPTSKRGWWNWAKTTTCEYLLRCSLSKIDSQHFWDLMDALPVEAIAKIEYELLNNVFETYDLESDTKVFKTVIGKIKNRIKGLGLDIERHTVVFDRGNNSKKNLATVKALQLHYAGALTPYHHKKLLEDAMEGFQELEVDGKGIHAYRDNRTIWQEERTVIVFISEKLKSGQIRGIYQSLEKAEKQLRELQESLCKPKAACRYGAMKRKKEQLEDKITSIVKGQFVKDIIDWSLQGISEGKFQLEFTINQEKLGEIEKKLGFRILMTDRHDWSTVDIIKTYYGQSMIEHAFKNLKNPYHLALRPQFHWTDQKIKVHFFICVLGYLLAAIVWREARTKAQFKGTLDTLLDTLNNVRLATILEDTKTRGRVKATYKLEEMSEVEELIVKASGIKDTHYDRLKFRGVSVYN